MLPFTTAIEVTDSATGVGSPTGLVVIGSHSRTVESVPDEARIMRPSGSGTAATALIRPV